MPAQRIDRTGLNAEFGMSWRASPTVHVAKQTNACLNENKNMCSVTLDTCHNGNCNRSDSMDLRVHCLGEIRALICIIVSG